MTIVRHYVNNAPTTTLTSAATGSDTAFLVASTVGFPAAFPYTATVELGSASAEVVLVTGVSGSSVTVTRNYDGNGAYSHSAGVNFNHTAVALDYAEANALVNRPVATDSGWLTSVVTSTGLTSTASRTVGNVNYLHFTGVTTDGAINHNVAIGTIVGPAAFKPTYTTNATIALVRYGTGVVTLDSSGAVTLISLSFPASNPVPAGVPFAGAFCFPANV